MWRICARISIRRYADDGAQRIREERAGAGPVVDPGVENSGIGSALIRAGFEACGEWRVGDRFRAEQSGLLQAYRLRRRSRQRLCTPLFGRTLHDSSNTRKRDAARRPADLSGALHGFGFDGCAARRIFVETPSAGARRACKIPLDSEQTEAASSFPIALHTICG